MDLSDALRLARLRERIATGEALALRTSRRLSLAEVAAPCRTNTANVSRWERGLQTPRGPAALRYARLLDKLGRLDHAVISPATDEREPTVPEMGVQMKIPGQAATGTDTDQPEKPTAA